MTIASNDNAITYATKAKIAASLRGRRIRLTNSSSVRPWQGSKH